jgi:ribulose-phosphate 3-epimerase
MVEQLLEKKNKDLLLDVSLWSGNLLDLESSIEETEQCADLYHLDVADAHFVPGLLFFPDLIHAIDRRTSVPLHSHLMMDEPEKHLDDFIEAGSDIITVHIEIGNEKIDDVSSQLKKKGIAFGLAICTESDVSLLEPYINDIDLILVMGTKIGIKGVGMDPETPNRVAAIKRMLRVTGREHDVIVSVDGGIRTNTVPAVRAAGADMITPGSLVFKSEDLSQTLSWLHSLKVGTK